MASLIDRLRGHNPHNESLQRMLALNPKAGCHIENGMSVFIEDVPDSDGRWYLFEFQCNPDGTGTRVFVRYNPWNPANPNKPDEHDPHDVHFWEGEVCIGPASHGQGAGYDLEYAVLRARHWANCYSFLREHGVAKLRELEPEW